MIAVELFGVPRLRAGTGRVEFPASTVAEALRGLAAACPVLDGSVIVGGGVHPAYRLSLNGDRFVTDPTTPMADGDCLWLLAADAGG